MTFPPVVGVLYQELPGDPRLVKARGDIDTSVRAALAGAVGIGVVSAILVAFSPPMGGIGILVAGGLAGYAMLERREIEYCGSNSVTNEGIHGNSLPGKKVDIKSVVRVFSYRYERDVGEFVIHLEGGSKARVPAYCLADPDAYWAALRTVVARAEGWEWTQDGKRIKR
jgi:hypothetical protein